MAGLESLGVYNMSLVKNKEHFNHEPAELIIPAGTLMEEINGEKVFDPNGKLEYIVQNDGKYETRYYPNEEKPQNVGVVEVKDAYNGKLIKEQLSTIGNWANVTEYSQNEPNISYTTCYSEMFGGKAGYILTKQQVMEEIKEFVNEVG